MPAADTPLHHDHVMALLSPIQPLLDDPDVSEVMVNGPELVFYERAGQLHGCTHRFENHDALMAAVRAIAQFIGKRVDARHPILEGRLPDGSRVEAVIPPAAPAGPMLALRRFRRVQLDLDELVGAGSLTFEAAQFLRARVLAGANILVSGGTGSGKSALLTVLAAQIPDRERVVVIEDAQELQLRRSHLVQLEACELGGAQRASVTIRELLRATLRLRPDRIIVGEIRGAEALDLVHAMTSGHGGGLSTIHASHPYDALRRLEMYCLLADAGLGVQVLRPQIASAIDLVVQMDRSASGGRRVTHVCEVEGFGATGFRVTDRFSLDAHGALQPNEQPTRRAS